MFDPNRWHLVLAVGLALTGLFVILPYGVVTEWLYVAIGLGAAAAILLVVRRRGAARPIAWRLLAGAVGLTALGDATWVVLDLQGLEPFPSLADALYLLAYPLYGAALWTLGGRRTRDFGALTDALIVGIAAAVLGWLVLVSPHLEDATLTLVQRLVALAYPVADQILIPLAVRLVFLHRARVGAHLLLLIGTALFLAADMLFAVTSLDGLYVPGGVTDGMWLVGYVLFATAAWHPSALVPLPDRPATSELSPGRLAFLAAAALVAPIVILVRAGSDDRVVAIAGSASILLFLLVVSRMAGLVRQIRRQADDLERLSRTDPLTGAANRRHLDIEFARELSRAERTGAPLCLAILDLDHFKPFNDTYGHPAGDALLRALVETWQSELRLVDLLVRFGGEEFLVVFPESDLAATEAAVERLRELVPLGQTCSAGVAQHLQGETASQLISRADQALYAAKARGRDRTVRAAAGPGPTPAASPDSMAMPRR